jgi:sulfur-oxidizing protein SoxX
MLAAAAVLALALAVVGDGVPEPLTATPGDPVRGRTIVASRQAGLCLLCHQAPIGDAAARRQQGNIATDLAGAGSRFSAAQLRLRVADARRLNPDSLMPSFYRADAGERVASAFAGRPVLDAQQIEDVVAYLLTLK